MQHHLILTEPGLHDIEAFHFLTCDPAIKKEFVQFRLFTIDDAKKHLDYWIGLNQQKDLQFLRMIKVSPLNIGETDIWDESNSYLVGFLANSNDASPYATSRTTLNFGIHSDWCNKGLMTMSLNMNDDYMKSRGYNFAAAFVKHGNIASSKVLQKCNFQVDEENPFGTTYIKFLK
jgi:RimJ/RimL family protein N-acetyltransferase